jgi:surfeit locus 1 family protein
MLNALRQPKWMVAAFVVGLVAVLCVRLGFWQLDRLEQRQVDNAVGESRLVAEPADLASLLADADDDLEPLEYRRVVLRGVFDPTEEVLIRSQVELGQAGFHVITPLVGDEEWAVLVNRGWVPLGMDQPPVEAAPGQGEVEIEAWIHLTQTRPALGPEDQPGEQSVFNRVDIGRLVEQMPYGLAPVYVVAMGDQATDLPIIVDPPDFDNEGPHLAYAIQWFGFAAVGLIGFYFLSRKKGVTADNPRDRGP